MIKIGLTGGIGSGKSTVSEYLKKLGYEIIDADAIGREITSKGSKTLKIIRNEFGNDIINENGELNRKRLANIVFKDNDKRVILDRITHDKICGIIRNRLVMSKGRIVFLDAPLLFETGLDKDVDSIWVVVANQKDRVKRVVARDNINEKDVLDRMNNQTGDEEKIAAADYVIDNSNSKEELIKAVDGLLEKYAKYKH